MIDMKKKNNNNSLAQNVHNCSVEPIIININMGGGAIINNIFISLSYCYCHYKPCR